jgi:hypothetical protein
MKNKIIATLVAFGMVGSASALEINENLSINGFVDTSYSHVENDATGGNDSQKLGLDEIELNFLFNVGGASGAIHIDNTDDQQDGADYADGNDIDIEQAFIGYSLESGVSLTIGKYGSLLGLEREDPTSMNTFSRAYSTDAVGNQFNLGDVDSNVFEGLRLGYSSDVFSLGLSLQNTGNEDIEDNELDMEFSVAYTGIENLTIGGGYRFDNQAGAATEVDVLNVYATTVVGKFALGAEYIELENGGGSDQDLDGWQVAADYGVSEKLGVTLRLSSNELNGNDDYEKVTLSPNYQLTDSLFAILEYSDVDLGQGGDANELALELTFTF